MSSLYRRGNWDIEKLNNLLKAANVSYSYLEPWQTVQNLWTIITCYRILILKWQWKTLRKHLSETFPILYVYKRQGKIRLMAFFLLCEMLWYSFLCLKWYYFENAHQEEIKPRKDNTFMCYLLDGNFLNT